MQSPPASQSDYAKNRKNIASAGNIIEELFFRLISALDVLFSRLQSAIGIKGMAYVFVLPNLIIFGIFILFPMLLNFGYAFSGGSELFLNERDFVGTANVEQLFQCEDLLNYRTCREDEFIRAIGNTVFFVTSQVSLMVGISLMTALALNRDIRGRAFFRSVFFYPVLLSPIVVALLWRWILQESGILNAFLVNYGTLSLSILAQSITTILIMLPLLFLLRKGPTFNSKISIVITAIVVGSLWLWIIRNYGTLNPGIQTQSITTILIVLPLLLLLAKEHIFNSKNSIVITAIVVGILWLWIIRETGLLNDFLAEFEFTRIGFLTQVTTARAWVVLISVWSQMGFYTLILLAGLQAIPPDLYEAADIDGANGFNKFWSVTMPLLAPTMLVVVVLSLIRAVQVFDIVFAFTGGGPGTATLFLVQYIYDNGFVGDKRYGIAAAASLVMAGTLIIFTLIQLRLQKNQEDE